MEGRRERGKFLEEEGVVNSVEGLGEVESGGDGAQRRFLLVEAEGNLGGERKEGGGAGVTRSEAVLMQRTRKRMEEEWTDETFEELGGRTEEGNGAVRG